MEYTDHRCALPASVPPPATSTWLLKSPSASTVVGQARLIVFDDLSKAGRGLPCGVAGFAPPAGPRKHTPAIFYLPPAGRCAKLSDALGGGSTGLPIIETKANDV